MARRLNDYPEIIVQAGNLCEPVDFENIFGRAGAVHIEIGSGKGTFLISQAKAQPEVNFLGIEWARKYCRFAVDRIGRWGIKNVKLIRTDAADFIIRFVPDSSVACYHIYYPDPWPKKRHHKRRFICTANMEHLLRTLEPGGVIQIATDHIDYFEQIKNTLAQKKDVLEPVEFMPPAGAENGETVGTNFERKYIKQSRNVYTAAVRKKTN
ncbi:MAG: tRNA (guanosine(46)-N7)-methyltransferase TrmB [Phycisphaerae bacterium]|jgi:tRNA (guanine-N7-)-methyltransferase